MEMSKQVTVFISSNEFFRVNVNKPREVVATEQLKTISNSR